MSNAKIYNYIEHLTEMKSLFAAMDFPEPHLEIVDVAAFDKFVDSVNVLIAQLKKEVDEKSTTLSYGINPKHLNADKYWQFYEKVKYDEITQTTLLSKVNQLIGIDTPVLELFPGTGNFTNKFVSAEPFYVADYFMSNLNKVGQQFNDFYNTRRLFKIDVKDFDLSQVPQSQIGLVISLNYFIVKDSEFIINWAKEVYKVLRPTGYFIFNFIPDSTIDGIKMVSGNRLSYSNPQLLEYQLLDIGFKNIQIDLKPNFGSTIVAQKLQDFTNIKKSASISRIIEKSETIV